MLQRDVYILPRDDADGGGDGDGDGVAKGSFSDARQPHFTAHAFRFVEVCYIVEPPAGMITVGEGLNSTKTSCNADDILMN